MEKTVIDPNCLKLPTAGEGKDNWKMPRKSGKGLIN